MKLISCSEEILIQPAAFTTSPLMGGATTQRRKQASTPPIVSGVIILHIYSEKYQVSKKDIKLTKKCCFVSCPECKKHFKAMFINVCNFSIFDVKKYISNAEITV